MPDNTQFTMCKKLLLFCVVIILISSCSDDEEIGGLSTYDNSVIEYFTDVALGFEFGTASETTRKWTSPMKIFVGDNVTVDLMNELKKITTEINDLATDSFNVSIVTDTLQSNFYIFLGSGATYAKIFPSQAGFINTNWGLFNVDWNTNDQLYRGNMYVDLVRASPIEQKHLLREELTQSLGLAKDSFRYTESIFQSSWTTTTDYADIDRDLIRLLYHPDMQIGLNKEQVDDVLKRILLMEK